MFAADSMSAESTGPLTEAVDRPVESATLLRTTEGTLAEPNSTLSSSSADTVGAVQQLRMLAHARRWSNAKAERIAAAIDTNERSWSDYIDELLHAAEFAQTVAPRLVLGEPIASKAAGPMPASMVLTQVAKHDGVPIYGLRDTCRAAEAIAVSPWWDPEHEILVCPDSYQPTVLHDGQGNTCGASVLDPSASTVCGCGPRLVYCTASKRHLQQVNTSLTAEVYDTIAASIAADRPLDEIFLSGETVYDQNVATVYARAAWVNGDNRAFDTLRPATERPVLQRQQRPELFAGQHAGILSAPAMIYGSDALRGVLRNYYELLWCKNVLSREVSAESVLDLHEVDLRVGGGWQALAHHEVCGDCHARLDYGMQFFAAYPSSLSGIDPRLDDRARGQGLLYGNDVGDPRGQGSLTPHGFAELALAQPEFGECITRRVLDQMVPGVADESTYTAVHREFVATRRLTPMVRVALEQLVAARIDRHKVTSRSLATPDATSNIASSNDWTQVFDEHCGECHGPTDRIDLSAANHELLSRALWQVATGEMPPVDHAVTVPQRDALVDALLRELHPDEQTRSAVRQQIAIVLDSPPTYTVTDLPALLGDASATTRRLQALAPISSPRHQTFSPTFAVAAGLVALQACEHEFDTPQEIEACIIDRTDPKWLVKP